MMNVEVNMTISFLKKYQINLLDKSFIVYIYAK
jgi:hypothetical protein